MKKIDRFDTEYAFLSNFAYAPFTFNGAHYPTSEHAYQAAKVLDYDKHELVRKARTPGLAKKLGRQYSDWPDFHKCKVRMMKDILRCKFDQNPDLKDGLLATGDAELVEGNTWGDTFWGVCDGVGENWLGKVLMDLRAEYNGADQG